MHAAMELHVGVTVLVFCCFTAIIGEGAVTDHEGNSPLLRTARTTHGLDTGENSTDVPYIEILSGRDGTPGEDGKDGREGNDGEIGEKGDIGTEGPPGPQGPSGGGVIYTRWGRTVCPTTSGTTLVYSGRMGGGHNSHYGLGANYLCLPDDPQYDTSYEQAGFATLKGGEYKSIEGLHDHNVPCAVCHVTTRSSHLMIPAKTDCPSSWTREYHGHLVTDNPRNNKVFECLDSSPEALPGGAGSSYSEAVANIQHVKATCIGLDCSQYNSIKVLTCALCTK